MNNRISTGMMFNQSISMMMAKQSKMNHLEQDPCHPFRAQSMCEITEKNYKEHCVH